MGSGKGVIKAQPDSAPDTKIAQNSRCHGLFESVLIVSLRMYIEGFFALNCRRMYSFWLHLETGCFPRYYTMTCSFSSRW